MSKKSVLRGLRRLPGVGKSLSHDLYDIGIRAIVDLRGKNPELLYAELCRAKPHRKHPCVLYIFRCAVYFASAKTLNPLLLKWWPWKDIPVYTRNRLK